MNTREFLVSMTAWGAVVCASSQDGRGFLRAHVGRHRAVAALAVVLKDPGAGLLNNDGLLEASGCEELSVAPAVLCLGEVLRYEGIRQVAIDAHRRGVMARLLPAVVLGLHDVAVGAGGWISLEVRKPLRVPEGESAGASEATDGHREEQWAER